MLEADFVHSMFHEEDDGSKNNMNKSMDNDIPLNESCKDVDTRMNLQFEEMVNASQNQGDTEVISEKSPEDWFLKYKHEKGKARYLAKRYNKLREKHKNLKINHEKVKKDNAQLLAKLKVLSSNLKDTMDKMNTVLNS